MNREPGIIIERSVLDSPTETMPSGSIPSIRESFSTNTPFSCELTRAGEGPRNQLSSSQSKPLATQSSTLSIDAMALTKTSTPAETMATNIPLLCSSRTTSRAPAISVIPE